MYVAGGRSGSKSHLKSAEKYDSVRDEWIEVEDMKKKRSDAGKENINISDFTINFIIFHRS